MTSVKIPPGILDMCVCLEIGGPKIGGCPFGSPFTHSKRRATNSKTNSRAHVQKTMMFVQPLQSEGLGLSPNGEPSRGVPFLRGRQKCVLVLLVSLATTQKGFP